MPSGLEEGLVWGMDLTPLAVDVRRIRSLTSTAYPAIWRT
jgi:hypothetical protein